ncbi:MAG: TonB-dependent receptor [Pseudomonadota bacterium]
MRLFNGRASHCAGLLCGLAGLATMAQAHASEPASEDLAVLSLEELGNVPVISVSRSPQLLSGAAAAIYVISHDEIARSGATSLPDALRLAPNLLITQQGSSNFVAAARGLGGKPEVQNFSNKLLLLIDGRSAYSPLYSGIYLDAPDLVMEDIDRIEVISGPGATLWGANAVNGVINVITRPAYLTDGTSVTAIAGPREQDLSVRHGGEINELAYRVYAKGFQRDHASLEDGSSAEDAWYKGQVGFRMDWSLAAGTATLQGDAYSGLEDQPGPGKQAISGANVVGRWQTHTDRTDLQLQGYFDHSQRAAPMDGGAFVLNTFDLEFQQGMNVGAAQKMVWGAGARLHRYDIANSSTLLFLPSERTLQLWNIFGQDTVTLNPALRLIVGLKLEHNSFTGWEPQPDARLAWQVNDSTLLWTSVSRAARTPTPFDADVLEKVGSVDFLTGNKDFESEEVWAYELGYRGALAPGLSLSVSGFYNVYDELRTIEPASGTVFLPLRWDNQMQGHTYGMTAWAKWQIADWWRLAPGFSLLRKDLHFKPGASGLTGIGQSGNDPRGHALLTSSMDLGPDRTLDVSIRHVVSLPDPALPSYTEITARFAWRVSPAWELSVAGTNLLHASHLEYPATTGAEIQRNVVAEARWTPR